MRNVLAVVSGLLVTIALAAVAPLAWAGSPSTNPGSNDPRNTAYLGVHIDDVSSERAASLKLKDASGVLITDLDQDGPACRAGLKENDIIVGFNGAKVANSAELASLIHATAPNKPATLAILRDGQKKDVQVMLGNMGQVMARYNVGPRVPMAMPAPLPAPMPDVDIPNFTTFSARHGMVVETLTPQLCDFFGVPHGSGVLLRSVEKGTPADAAGLKAGDVILKINNEPVHDIADWRRAMHHREGKVAVAIIRDKREQTVQLILPPQNNSKLKDFDWEGVNQQAFEKNMESFRQEMDKLRPELEQQQKEMIASTKPSQQELEQMRSDLQKSMQLSQKDIERMRRDIQRSVPSQSDIEKMQSDVAKAFPSPADVEKMRSDVANSVPSPADMEKMRSEIQASLPTQADLDRMRQQIDDSLKSLTPQLQQQMQELKKQMEQQKLDMQEMMKGLDSEREF